MKRDPGFKDKIRRSRQLICLGIYSLKRDGVAITAGKVRNYIDLGRRLTYEKWAEQPLFTDEQLEDQRKHSFDKTIRFSIATPLFNTEEEHLRDMIESVMAQTYPYWELCLGDGSDDRHAYVGRICREYAEKDSRIRYRKLKENYGIAGNSNACIEMAEGDYISLLDHDDVLHPAALHETMERICEENADFVFTDEAIFKEHDLKKISGIHFKKDYAPDDLITNNYMCHFSSFSRALVEKCGGFREGFDGSQDHELFLRLTDAAGKISHIPEVLYYWRAHSGSTAADADNKSYAGEAGKKAVRSFLEASGVRAKVENARGLPTTYRVSYEITGEPKVSIVIPSCDHAGELRACISSILERTSYGNYEMIIVENNSKEPATFGYYEELERGHENIKLITWPGKGFNWSAINNHAVREEASGEYILLLNNDTEVISPDWIQEMLMHAQRPDVGAVGAMLYYPDDTIQHAGVIIGLGGIAGHISSKCKRHSIGYMSRLCYAQDMSAVTGACMMVRRDVYEQVGGMDEAFTVGLNDIDFCLRVREAGYLIVWTPFAELYHHESKSRGIYDTAEDRIRTESEKDLFCERWADILKEGDPYYNPNFSLMSYNYELKKRDKETNGRRYRAADHTFAILAYKESPYLEDCIKSVMAQTVKGKVIICTSTPNEHIEGLAKRYGVPILINENYRGIGADWNFAYGQAKTPLVTLVHQDDIYERTFLEKTLEQLSSAGSPLIAFTDYYEIQGSRIVTHEDFINLRIKKIMLSPLRIGKIQSVRWIRRRMLSLADPVCCPSVTYVKENLPYKLFDEDLSGSVDWAAWEMISRRDGDFVYIPEMLMGHRMYTGSSTLELIRSGRRKKEDYEVLRRFWPDPIAKAINEIYSQSQRKRKEKLEEGKKKDGWERSE